jgi:hypothetical protein
MSFFPFNTELQKWLSHSEENRGKYERRLDKEATWDSAPHEILN